MTDDNYLRSLNVEIGEREAAGDVDYFVGLLAPAFAMRRANGETNDFGQFVKKVAAGPRRPGLERRRSQLAPVQAVPAGQVVPEKPEVSWGSRRAAPPLHAASGQYALPVKSSVTAPKRFTVNVSSPRAKPSTARVAPWTT